jgi:hypothetical protein
VGTRKHAFAVIVGVGVLATIVGHVFFEHEAHEDLHGQLFSLSVLVYLRF